MLNLAKNNVTFIDLNDKIQTLMPSKGLNHETHRVNFHINVTSLTHSIIYEKMAVARTHKF